MPEAPSEKRGNENYGAPAVLGAPASSPSITVLVKGVFIQRRHGSRNIRDRL